MTRSQLWLAPIALALCAGCALAAVVSMPPGSYLLAAAAVALGLAFLCFAEGGGSGGR